MARLKTFPLVQQLLNIVRIAASWDWREVVTSAFVLAVIPGGYIYFVG